MKNCRLLLFLFCIGGFTACASASQSIARVWNEQALSAIRIDTPHPPVQARNLFHLSVVMYDAWAAFTNVAIGYIYHGKATAADVEVARREAISHAAYRLLRERYALSRNATNTLPVLDAQMAALDYDTNNVSANPATPAGLGNLVAATVASYFIQDGCRQLQSYQDLPAGQGGVKWIWSETWMPYQRATFVTPAFPGFISGHSSFSRAAAEVLTAITGSAFFLGGLGTFTVVSNSLTIERGPSQIVVMQWGTYFDAADQAGLSRLYGGIHPSADDFAGRRAGAQCGQGAWALARQYFDGSMISNSVTLAIRPLNSGQCELRYETLRGLYYKLQSTADLLLSFADEPGGFVQATDAWAVKVESPPVPQKFYRVVRALTP